MKKNNVITLFFTTVLALLAISCIHLGNEKIVRTERTLNPFESVNCGENAEIRFHASQDYRAVLTVDSNLEQFVVLKIKNKNLNIKTKPGPSCFFSTFIVDIYCPYLSGVALSGSGHFSGIDKIIAPSFKSHISGSGKIEGSVECGNYIANISGSGKINENIVCTSLSANISGAGEIAVTGTGNTSNIKITGSGNFKGIGFKTNTAFTHTSGSGNIYIWVLEAVDAKTTGSGSIIYRGTPKVNFSGSGSGRIKSE
jgi:hypothetical protein